MNIDDLVKLWIEKFGREPIQRPTLGRRSEVTIEIVHLPTANTDRIRITNSMGTHVILTQIFHDQLFARWTALKKEDNHLATSKYALPSFTSDAGKIGTPYIPIIYRELDLVYRDLDL